MNSLRFIRTLIIALAITMPAVIAGKDFTVVIDPGHGGKDYGAIGSSTNEKSINLAVAKKLVKLIEENMPDVKIVNTRSNDTFVTLQGRADIANKAEGDLFISIHTNSIDKKAKNHRTVAGASVYTLGFRRSEENLAVAMRENAVMKLEADYSTVYEGFDPSSTESYIIFEMSQNKHMEQSVAAASAIQKELVITAGRRDRGVRQANFWVLFKTSMPAILVELDFICNPTQEAFMKSEAGQDKLAKAIYNGFAEYKRSSDRQQAIIDGRPVEKTAKETRKEKKKRPEQATVTKEEPAASHPEPQTPVANNTATSDIIYKVQFLTSPKILSPSSPQLKGVKDAAHYTDGGVVKYTVGNFSSQQEAAPTLREIKKKFPDAFIIKTRDGKRIK